MLLIGLTGGIGSGKSTVAELFAKKKVPILDADLIARELTQPNEFAYQEILKKFGNQILLPNQHLNRKMLRNLIFSHPEKRVWLEKLLHPLIYARINHQIQTLQSPYCIIIIPLLIESPPTDFTFDRILVIDTTETLQRFRITQRDQLSDDLITAILNSQSTRQLRIKNATDIIDNMGDFNNLQRQVDSLHMFYLSLSTKREEY